MASTPDTPKKRGRPARKEKKAIDEFIKNAKKEGLMPHEILLKAARGEPFTIRKLVIVRYRTGPQKGEEKERRWVDEDYYPTYAEQMEAARSAAPYFAPRLATQTVKTDDATADALTAVMKEMSNKLPG